MGKDFNQLVETLKNNDPSVRESALMELGRMCDERTLDLFVVILKNDNEPHNRRLAAIYLGKLKNKRAADVLLETLENDHDGWVRAGAAIGIGEMPYDQRLADALFRASMNDPDWRVTGESSEALGKISGK